MFPAPGTSEQAHESVGWQACLTPSPQARVTKARSARADLVCFPSNPAGTSRRARDQGAELDLRPGPLIQLLESCPWPRARLIPPQASVLLPGESSDPAIISTRIPVSHLPGGCGAHRGNLDWMIRRHASPHGETTCSAHPRGGAVCLIYRGAPSALSGLCVQQRGHRTHTQEVLQPSLAVSPPLWGPKPTGHLAPFTGFPPRVCPASHRVQPDGPMASYTLPSLGSSPSPAGLVSSVLALVRAQGLLPQLGPWLTFPAPSLQLDRPGRVPAGGPGCSPGPALWPQPAPGPC